MQLYELPSEISVNTLKQLRQRKPLIHCLTNDVVKNLTANILLSLGASPFMVAEPEEAAQLSNIADALLINIGTICQNQSSTILAALEIAKIIDIPWVLDPVGIGLLSYRSNFAKNLLTMKPTVIRGNASEILALAGFKFKSFGVDSNDDVIQALPAAYKLANQYGSIIVITGIIDIITDGKHIWQISDGHELMTRTTGIGCALSAIIAACCTLSGKYIDHIAGACRILARAGRLTASKVEGPGSLSNKILDTLYNLNSSDLK